MFTRVRLLLTHDQADALNTWIDWWISRGRLIEYAHDQGRCFDLLPDVDAIYDKDRHDWAVSYAKHLQSHGYNACAVGDYFTAEVIYNSREKFNART